MFSDKLSRYDLENYTASGTGTGLTKVTTVALCISCSQAKMQNLKPSLQIFGNFHLKFCDRVFYDNKITSLDMEKKWAGTWPCTF